MKMKSIFAAAAMCGAIAAFANSETARPKVDMSPEAQYKRTGGQLCLSRGLGPHSDQ